MLLNCPSQGPLLLGQTSDVLIIYKIVKCYLIVPLKVLIIYKGGKWYLIVPLKRPSLLLDRFQMC